MQISVCLGQEAAVLISMERFNDDIGLEMTLIYIIRSRLQFIYNCRDYNYIFI